MGLIFTLALEPSFFNSYMHLYAVQFVPHSMISNTFNATEASFSHVPSTSVRFGQLSKLISYHAKKLEIDSSFVNIFAVMLTSINAKKTFSLKHSVRAVRSYI